MNRFTNSTACLAAGVLSLRHISMPRNMRERKVWKSRSRKVGMCLRLRERTPEESRVTCCVSVSRSGPERMIPLELSGAARYCRLAIGFGFGLGNADRFESRVEQVFAHNNVVL